MGKDGENLPAAANMIELVYDEDLAKEAQKLANQCMQNKRLPPMLRESKSK
jgi:Cysteine-rich secretory protein family